MSLRLVLVLTPARRGRLCSTGAAAGTSPAGAASYSRRQGPCASLARLLALPVRPHAPPPRKGPCASLARLSALPARPHAPPARTGTLCSTGAAANPRSAGAALCSTGAAATLRSARRGSVLYRCGSGLVLQRRGLMLRRLGRYFVFHWHRGHLALRRRGFMLYRCGKRLLGCQLRWRLSAITSLPENAPGRGGVAAIGGFSSRSRAGGIAAAALGAAGLQSGVGDARARRPFRLRSVALERRHCRRYSSLD